MSRSQQKIPRKIPMWAVSLPFAVALAGLVALFLHSPRASRTARGPDPAEAASLAAVPPSEPAPPLPTRDAQPLVAIVIDDLGYDIPALERLLALQVPLTFAVLPGRPYSAEAAALASREGRELILHQPMEAQVHSDTVENGENPYNSPQAPDPGPGAVFVFMSDEQVTSQVERNLERFPGIVGMNNHMGSRFTRNGPKMRAALAPLFRRGLYFLDSRTAPDSAAYETARDLGLRAIQRDVFLDHELTVDAVRAQFERLVRLAKAEGHAVAIGHPHPETVEVLEREIPRLEAHGVRLVPAGVLAARLDKAQEPQLFATDSAPAPK